MVHALGARLVIDDVAMADGTPRHDPALLAAAYARIMQSTALDPVTG